MQGVTRLSLSNGLTVLLKEIHTSPIISQWVWYRVGSRDEVSGLTGATHWVEHMQFKGTPTYPTSMLDKEIARLGGHWNAFTFLDWTTYYEILPADKIDLALRLEADRMTNSLFSPADFESERSVIISERQGSENEPLFLLGEEVQAASFRVHPYHHEILGDMGDIEHLSREQVFRHYQTYYVPNNAILALAGDFETEAMLARIRQLYEPIPAGLEPPRPYWVEPPQAGERTVTVEGPGETTYLQLAYHCPAAGQPDFFPFTILDSLLTGPSNLNLFGGGISNKTSRLYRALVETELAVSVYGGFSATIDPYLYTITLTVHPERSPEEVVAAINAEIQRLLDSPPPQEELDRATKQARALFAYGSESISNQAFWLGFAEMFATYAWFENYLQSLAVVTPQDVQRVVQTYLHPKNRIMGLYKPTGNASPGDGETSDAGDMGDDDPTDGLFGPDPAGGASPLPEVIL